MERQRDSGRETATKISTEREIESVREPGKSNQNFNKKRPKN
jgi:hypothetical protein